MLTERSIVTIALTREAGENEKLKSLLSDYSCIEIPCIQFSDGPDRGWLDQAILEHDGILITSPQAATVFLSAWHAKGRPKVSVATVGSGTSKVLQKSGINPVFEPSVSTGEILAKELPTSFAKKILHPTSSLAEETIATILRDRGFEVRESFLIFTK
jgi:uroporphyrinogen-III synthase